MSANLIAYIPTLNKRHLSWLASHQSSDLFLINQTEAEQLLPRLSRNMAALPTQMVQRIIESEHVVRKVWIFSPDMDEPDLSSHVWKEWILPDEDVSHQLVKKYLPLPDFKVSFELIWARHDMRSVLENQPVIADVEISNEAFDVEFLNDAGRLARKSPDWWRQVGAIAVNSFGKRLAAAYNTHMPNEYETYIFGDPSINRDAGQKGKSCALHAEQAVIGFCAKHGVALNEMQLYVTTFPCEICANQIACAGFKTLFFREGYSSLNAQEILRSRGVRIVQVV